ncbi:hypothetical protein [Malaciobacter mytili]|uniref:hypothetical protein n=1 Tax=Malaciobacter mytili TaxID=603050 RepID=UPI003A888EDB
MRIKNEINYKILERLFLFTRQTWSKWKKEKRPVVELVEKYFTDEDLEEFLETNKIYKMELLQKVEDDIYSNSIDLLSIFHELEITKPINTDLFIAQIFLEPKNSILLLTNSYLEWKEDILKNSDSFELNKLIETVIKYEFLTKYYNTLEYFHNKEMENIIHIITKTDDINLINTSIKLYIFYKIFKFAPTSFITKSQILETINSMYNVSKIHSKNKNITQHIRTLNEEINKYIKFLSDEAKKYRTKIDDEINTLYETNIDKLQSKL